MLRYFAALSTAENFRAYDVSDIVDALATRRPTWITLRAVRKNRTTGMVINSVLVNALGFVATGFSILMWLPQARTTWQNRNDPLRLTGISEATQWLLVTCYLLWGAYGVVSQSLWVSAPSVLAVPLAIVTIVIVRRGRTLPLVTRSIPIITVDEPMSAGATTATTPIILAGQPADVGELMPGFTYTGTGTIPILN